MTGPATLLYGRRSASAVVVRSGVIESVGTTALESTAESRQIVEIGDGILVPAFRDGHAHPLQAGQTLLGPPIGTARTIEELLLSVADYASARPQDEWLVGAGYEPTLLPDGLGSASVLDRAEAGRPVVLWANDHHSAWANSLALARAGVGPSTPDPPRGRFIRRADGSPTGALLEEAAHAVASHAPRPTVDSQADGLRLALARLASAGVAWVQEASLDPVDVAPYVLLAQRGQLSCRINIALRVDPDRWRDQIPELVATRASLAGIDGLGARTVKFFADGVIESGTAALLEPYTDDPYSCGIANWSLDELSASMAAFDAEKFQIHVHAIGDGGVRMALDAVEYVLARNGVRDELTSGCVEIRGRGDALGTSGGTYPSG